MVLVVEKDKNLDFMKVRVLGVKLNLVGLMVRPKFVKMKNLK